MEVENYIKFSLTFKKNHTIDGTMWKKNITAEQDTYDSMGRASCMLESWGYNHALEYVTVFTLLLQQWLYNCPSLLHDTTLPALLWG
jgi:hypothetical protein